MDWEDFMSMMNVNRAGIQQRIARRSLALCWTKKNPNFFSLHQMDDGSRKSFVNVDQHIRLLFWNIAWRGMDQQQKVIEWFNSSFNVEKINKNIVYCFVWLWIQIFVSNPESLHTSLFASHHTRNEGIGTNRARNSTVITRVCVRDHFHNENSIELVWCGVVWCGVGVG